MAQRKIVQIATIGDTSFSCGAVYALCDDGTLWALGRQTAAAADQWQRVHDVPQPDSPNESRNGATNATTLKNSHAR